jgi:hypothetical protein
MGCDDTMKTWPLLMGITVILAIFCSPSLAISKSDLISQYKTGDFLTPVPTQTPRGMVVPVEPSPTPRLPSWYKPIANPDQSPAPSGGSSGTGSISVLSYPSGAKVYLDGTFKGYSPLTLTGVALGGHQITMTYPGLPNFTDSVWVVAGQPPLVVGTFTSAKGGIASAHGSELPPCKLCKPILEG